MTSLSKALGGVSNVSSEVIAHHLIVHHRACDGAGMWEVGCPCGTTTIFICSRCDSAVLLACTPGGECVHLALALSAYPELRA